MNKLQKPGMRQFPVAKLSVEERQGIREQTQEFEAVLKNQDGLATGLQDRSSLVRAHRRNQFILQRDAALVAKGRKKDSIAREIKQLEEEIAKHRPTRTMMAAKPGTPEFDRAVKMNLEFQRKYTPMMFHLKDLKRRLEPDDPDADNLERIRLT
jgi:predicted RNase H-like nuclease (RuvC/YqgF family)